MSTITNSNNFNQQDQYYLNQQNQYSPQAPPPATVCEQSNTLTKKEREVQQINQQSIQLDFDKKNISNQRNLITINKYCINMIIVYLLVVILFIWVILLQIQMVVNSNSESAIEKSNRSDNTQNPILQNYLKQFDQQIIQLNSLYNFLLNTLNSNIIEQESYNKKTSQVIDQIKNDLQRIQSQINTIILNIGNSIIDIQSSIVSINQSIDQKQKENNDIYLRYKKIEFSIILPSSVLRPHSAYYSKQKNQVIAIWKIDKLLQPDIYGYNKPIILQSDLEIDIIIVGTPTVSHYVIDWSQETGTEYVYTFIKENQIPYITQGFNKA